MITDLKLLKNGDLSPGVYGRIAIAARENGILHNFVKEYKRWNDIFIHVEMIKALLYSKWTYSEMAGAYETHPDKLLKLLEEVIGYEKISPTDSGEEFENAAMVLYDEMIKMYERITADFFEVNEQAFWSHSKSLFYAGVSVLEWTDLVYRFISTGEEGYINRSFVRPVFMNEIEEMPGIVEQIKKIDQRKMKLVSGEEISNETVLRNRISETIRETEELTGKGVFDEY